MFSVTQTHSVDYALSMVLTDWRNLQYFGGGPKNDEAVVWAAVTQSWQALQYAGQGPRNNVEIVLAALRQDIAAAQYIGEGPRYDERVVAIIGPVRQNHPQQAPTNPRPANRNRAITAAQSSNRAAAELPSSALRPAPASPRALEHDTVSKYGRLQVQDGKITSTITNKPVSLYGISHFWTNEGWGSDQFCTQTAVNKMCDLGVDVFRIPVGADPEEGGGYSSNPEQVRGRMDAVVNAAIAKDKYVIIDWHSHRASQRPENAVAFFTEMAELYGRCPNVIFEIYNEPLGGESWDSIKSYSEQVLSAIRANGAENLVIAGTPNWSQFVDDAACNPLTDQNTAYALHFYAGTHGEDIRNRARAAIDAGLALFVSECGGVLCTGDGDFNHQQWQEWIDLIQEHGLSTVCWHMGTTDKFESSSSIFQEVTTEQEWDPSCFTPSGQAFKALLDSPRIQDVPTAEPEQDDAAAEPDTAVTRNSRGG